MTDIKWETGENGISKIIPAKSSPKVKIENEPFLPLEDGEVWLEESFPVFNTDNQKLVDGIILFNVSQAGWHIIYCHTMSLEGLIWINQIARPTVSNLTIANSKDISSPDMKSFCFDSFEHSITGGFGRPNAILDYLTYPATTIIDSFDQYIELLIRKYDQQLSDNPNLDFDEAQQIIELIEDLNECKVDDFTLDVYTPPHLLLGTENHQYVRPAHGIFNPFYNPNKSEFWARPPKYVLKELNKAVTVDLPKYRLMTRFDSELCEKQIGKLAAKFNKPAPHQCSPFQRHKRRRHLTA